MLHSQSHKIHWCDITQRLKWGSESVTVMEQKRRRVNRHGHNITSQFNMLGKHFAHDIDYKTPGFFRPDGIHLSPVGLDMYLDKLQDQILAHL